MKTTRNDFWLFFCFKLKNLCSCNVEQTSGLCCFTGDFVNVNMSRRSVSRTCGPAGEVGEPHTAAHLESNIIALIHFKRRQTNTTCPHRNQPAARWIKIKAPLCSSLQTGKQLTRKPSGESGVRVIPKWEFLRFLETFWRAISPGQSAQHTFISW